LECVSHMVAEPRYKWAELQQNLLAYLQMNCLVAPKIKAFP